MLDSRVLNFPENHPRRRMFEEMLNRPPTPEQLQAKVVAYAQEKLDAFAKTKGYDGILSACTYVSSGNPKFAAEAARCVELRDLMWGTCYTIMASVGETLPTFEEVIAQLPTLSWE